MMDSNIVDKMVVALTSDAVEPYFKLNLKEMELSERDDSEREDKKVIESTSPIDLYPYQARYHYFKEFLDILMAATPGRLKLFSNVVAELKKKSIVNYIGDPLNIETIDFQGLTLDINIMYRLLLTSYEYISFSLYPQSPSIDGSYKDYGEEIVAHKIIGVQNVENRIFYELKKADKQIFQQLLELEHSEE